MKIPIPAVIAAPALSGGGYYLTRSSAAERIATVTPAEGEPLAAVALPEALTARARRGEAALEAVCADCHGQNAAGRTGFDPPLVHKIYEPGHHGDMAFYLAVQNGVRAHHWPFGNMSAQERLTRADVSDIIAYVRELQRHNGIN